MAITNSFKTAVSNGDIKSVRIMMKDSLLVDPTAQAYDTLYDCVRNSEIKDLYDKHDNRELVADKSAWDDNYMDKLMVQVVGNFSQERIDHLKKVVAHLRPPEESPLQHDSGPAPRPTQSTKSPHKKQSEYQRGKEEARRNGSYRGTKIVTGALTGAVVGGAIAVAAGATVIGGVTLGATVGGITIAIMTNGGK